MEDFDLDWEFILKQVDRRKHLCRYPPVCPECKADQIQLTDSFNAPAGWKCRECQHRFNFEPS